MPGANPIAGRDYRPNWGQGLQAKGSTCVGRGLPRWDCGTVTPTGVIMTITIRDHVPATIAFGATYDSSPSPRHSPGLFVHKCVLVEECCDPKGL